MRVCQCVDYGKPVQIVEVDEPTPCKGEVKVRMSSAGVAYVDALTARGLYQVKPSLPYVPGSEYCGVVESVGENVTRLKPGDKVFGLGMSLSMLAEKVCMPEATCVPLPEGVSEMAAGGFFASYLTALYGLKSCGDVKEGESVLVLGAAGAVGMAAVQVARALGARVIAAASTEAKRQVCLDAGADSVVDYTAEDWRQQIKQLTGGKGVDVVFDLVGGPLSEASLRSLSPSGRLLVVGFASGDIPSISLNLTLLKRCSIVGVNLGGHCLEDPGIVPPLIEELLTMLARKKIKLDEPEVFPLAETQAAFDKIMARKTVGKVVIDLR